MLEIKLSNLTKQFGSEEVVNISNLTIRSGELLALLGPSGCGKTTALKLISGLLMPDGGDILFDQESVIDIPPEARRAVLVFQDYLLFPHLTVEQNISFGLKMAGRSEQLQAERVEQLLDLVDLVGYQSARPQELSGGEKQRVALARAVAINPEVLLLDEPLTNLDAALREEMQEFICDLHEAESMTTVFVTHDRQEAMLIADRIAVMNQGRIEQVGQPETLYRQPETCFVSDFLGVSNYLSGRLEDDKLSFESGAISLPSSKFAAESEFNRGDRVKLLLRPEFINLVGEACPEAELKGRVVKRKFIGERISYQIKVGKQLLEATLLPPASFQVGDQVYLELDKDNIWLLPD